MIKIEFPADRLDIARAMGSALMKIGETVEATVNTVSASPEPDSAVPPNGEPNSDAATNDSEPDGPLIDMKGVAKDGKYCSTAQIPFYANGKRAGQWKRRQGVHEDAYDAWYAEQLALLSPEEPEPEPADTSGAFGNEPDPQPEQDEDIPTTCGEIMKWMSEQQVAGLLAQQDITAAYAEARLEVTDLFPPTTDAKARENIATLYGILIGKIGS